MLWPWKCTVCISVMPPTWSRYQTTFSPVYIVGGGMFPNTYPFMAAFRLLSQKSKLALSSFKGPGSSVRHLIFSSMYQLLFSSIVTNISENSRSTSILWPSLSKIPCKNGERRFNRLHNPCKIEWNCWGHWQRNSSNRPNTYGFIKFCRISENMTLADKKNCGISKHVPVDRPEPGFSKRAEITQG